MTRVSAETRWRGDDFPGWLSPMIVRELRQGIQSGAFYWTFMGLQAAVFLHFFFFCMFYAHTEQGSGPQRTFEQVFWAVFGVVVIFGLPLRGLGSISGERSAHKMDLVLLTRLSATRIVVGKWLAHIAEVFLVVTAILPYVGLFYFIGGVDVLASLVLVGWLCAVSALIAAVAIALSANPFWFRILAGIVAAFLLTLTPNYYTPIHEAFDLFSHPWESEWVDLLVYPGIVATYTIVLLEYAAARLAPQAENHTSRKRALALAVVAIWLILSLCGYSKAGLIIVATLPIVVVYAIEAIIEHPTHFKSQAAGFIRFGLLGRLAARLLMPGWHTGLVFAFVLSSIAMTAVWKVTDSRVDHLREFYLAIGTLVFATLIFPLPFLVWRDKRRYRLLVFIMVQGASSTVFSIVYSMKPRGALWEQWSVGWKPLLPIPAASLCSILAGSGMLRMESAFIYSSCIVSAIVCLVVLPVWFREMKTTTRLLAEAKAARGVVSEPATVMTTVEGVV